MDMTVRIDTMSSLKFKFLFFLVLIQSLRAASIAQLVVLFVWLFSYRFLLSWQLARYRLIIYLSSSEPEESAQEIENFD